MSELAEPLRPARVVEDPTAYEQLADFSCGAGDAAWESHVDRVVGRLYKGEAIPQTLVVLEDADGRLVGVCSFWLGDLMAPLFRTPIRDAPYINVIGVDRRFHGARLADGSHPGDVLLRGALAAIHGLHGYRHVFALVAPENARAHALFARHGFGEVSPLKEGRQALRIRPPLPV
jgi:hypothetical protein